MTLTKLISCDLTSPPTFPYSLEADPVWGCSYWLASPKQSADEDVASSTSEGDDLQDRFSGLLATLFDDVPVGGVSQLLDSNPVSRVIPPLIDVSGPDSHVVEVSRVDLTDVNGYKFVGGVSFISPSRTFCNKPLPRSASSNPPYLVVFGVNMAPLLGAPDQSVLSAHCDTIVIPVSHDGKQFPEDEKMPLFLRQHQYVMVKHQGLELEVLCQSDQDSGELGVKVKKVVIPFSHFNIALEQCDGKPLTYSRSELKRLSKLRLQSFCYASGTITLRKEFSVRRRIVTTRKKKGWSATFPPPSTKRTSPSWPKKGSKQHHQRSLNKFSQKTRGMESA